jgi:hypothetical protein
MLALNIASASAYSPTVPASRTEFDTQNPQ